MKHGMTSHAYYMRLGMPSGDVDVQGGSTTMEIEWWDPTKVDHQWAYKVNGNVETSKEAMIHQRVGKYGVPHSDIFWAFALRSSLALSCSRIAFRSSLAFELLENGFWISRDSWCFRSCCRPAKRVSMKAAKLKLMAMLGEY